jgi:diaminopimelate decarboxylase
MSQNAALKKAVTRFGTPLYVYEGAVISRRCRGLLNAIPSASFHYAAKANSNPAILGLIRKEGLGIEAVSPGELRAARAAGFTKSEISFTCSNLTFAELRYAAKNAGIVHLDSLRQIELWGKAKLGRRISVRLNLNIGAGHHAHVITGGPESKFGISLSDVPRAKALAKKYGLTITALHQHIGSNVLDAHILLRAAEALFVAARNFPDVTHLDFGGGFGVAYRSNERPLDIARFGRGFGALARAFEKETGRSMTYSFEPGRYIVAESGTLLAEVVDIKKTSRRTFVGVNASALNHLLRGILYGAHHEIENISRPNGRRLQVNVAGNICESSDMFARNRALASPEIGDILAMRNTGAYVMSMASLYNLRAPPREVLVSRGTLKDISFNKQKFL